MAVGKILVAYPGPVMRPLVWDRADVVILSDAGFWVVDSEGHRRLVGLTHFNPQWASGPDISDLITKVKEWSPVWVRWVAHADQYELLYREAVTYIARMMTALRALDVRSAIFHTGVSHHLDTCFLQVACAELQVPQLFLYDNIIVGRLLPLVQTASVEDRKPFGEAVSENDASDAVETFNQNRLSGNRPSLNSQTGPINRIFTSAWFGVIDAFLLACRWRTARAVKTAFGLTVSDGLEQFKPYGLPEFLRLICNQKRGLRYHDQRIRRGQLRELLPPGAAPIPLIAAHYQPEATSFPEGGRWNNHVDIAVKLRSLGYTGPIIYKEHIGTYLYYVSFIRQPRVGMNRSEGYYKLLEGLGCVFADPASIVDFEPATNARIVPVTITGTMAVERSLAGLRTIVAGHPWYAGLPGTLPLSELTSPNDCLPTSHDERLAISTQAKAFLSRMLTNTTLVNVPGIGNARPLNDPASLAVFAKEFDRLLEAMGRRYSTHA